MNLSVIVTVYNYLLLIADNYWLLASAGKKMLIVHPYFWRYLLNSGHILQIDDGVRPRVWSLLLSLVGSILNALSPHRLLFVRTCRPELTSLFLMLTLHTQYCRYSQLLAASLDCALIKTLQPDQNVEMTCCLWFGGAGPFFTVGFYCI